MENMEIQYCINLYPEAYLAAANRMVFPNLPSPIIEIIHLFRSISDVQVSKRNLRTILGFGQNSVIDSILERVLGHHIISERDILCDHIAHLVVHTRCWWEVALPLSYLQDSKTMLIAVRKDPQWFSNLPICHSDNKQIVRMLLYYSPITVTSWMSDRLKSDKRLAMEATSIAPHSLANFSEECKDDDTIVSTAVELDALTLAYASARLRNDYNLVRTAVTSRGSIVRCASEELRNNLSIMTLAIRSQPLAWFSRGALLHDNRDLAKIVLKRRGSMLRDMPFELRNDDELVVLALSKCGGAIRHVSQRLQQSEPLLRKAIINNAAMFPYATKRMKKDKALVFSVLKRNRRMYEYLSEDLKANQIVKAIMRESRI